MRYEPIKDRLSSIIGESTLLRRLLYTVLGLIFLREWHVKRGLRAIIKKSKPKKVLDAGSGFGQYSYYVAKKTDATILGVDINEPEVEKCNRFARSLRLNKLSFKKADLEQLQLDEKYDLIMSVDVMEHIKDDVRVFENFNRVLADGGSVLISTPSNFGGSNVHDEGEHSFIDEHYRDGYSAKDIAEKLEKAGLEPVSLTYTYGAVGSFYWRLAVKIPVELLNKSFVLVLVLPFYYLVAFPISLIFMLCDYFFPPARGSGLLVVARKR